MGYEFKGSQRLGEKQLNNQGCLMVVVEYKNFTDIIVEFQDGYKGKVHTSYQCFKNGEVKNPYYPSVCGVGIIGNKYSVYVNNNITKEYEAWRGIIRRCFDEKTKEKQPTYKDVSCCDGWLLYENFYEWLHSQENFDKWLNGKRWAVDKDILVKGNKCYSSKTCCLIPQDLNCLFTKRNNYRGSLPIGVYKSKNRFQAKCRNPITNDDVYLGSFEMSEAAFYAYKYYKENLIKQIAEIEYKKGNITKQCYETMLDYKVEITD